MKIFEYQPTMIHTKGMVIDGMFSLIGSSNLDPRSSEINEELDLAVYDRSFGQAMEAMFESDLSHSTEYTLKQFQGRSLWERMTEFVMLPFRSAVVKRKGAAIRKPAFASHPLRATVVGHLGVPGSEGAPQANV